jgi:adenosylmethionine-8-amino-7-oxononanoate aminotransferase
MANLDVLEQDRLIPRVAVLEQLLDGLLKQLQARRSSVVDVRVGGFLGGVTLSENIPAERAADPSSASSRVRCAATRCS